MIKSFLIALLLLITTQIQAIIWDPVYPFTQKTELDKVITKSNPYGVYEGPYGPGETSVYFNNKKLYSIDRYLSNPFFTFNNGRYLIEIDLQLYYLKVNTGSTGSDSNRYIYEASAVTIYNDGIINKSITIDELMIDPLTVKRERGKAIWSYNAEKSKKDKLKLKMQEHSAFIENGKLFLVSSDEQLIEIDIATGAISRNVHAYDILKARKKWKPEIIQRIYKKLNYPGRNLLPKLSNNKSIEAGLGYLFNKGPIKNDTGATACFYIHTLLINRSGKCEQLFVSASRLKMADTEKLEFLEDADYTAAARKWIMEQTFDTSSFPENFDKYKYTGYVFLK